ncbi:homoserine dehydrogenase [Acetobacter sp.]|uniref:homoserine dehydrogenase n=1 Tax=Acetobacter sp. TaxID=440 RepID=UPI0025BD9CA0|nr:homoserine dehydrogenase [Acetobacter sp.]MCH4090498.1 homoserine dehydrogenase [Acetobacter sp.]MCI1299192.1 homoserine dehydrogenase [Acetobacter sp.]MCI1315739.1 homoserine dehydrogenase [Acetobacter sp.]
MSSSKGDVASKTPLRLGVAGLGTVGAGLAILLRDNADIITTRAGRPIEITAVAARDRTRDRGIDLSALTWHSDAVDLASDPNVDVVVELIGGSEGTARALVEAALKAGKPVVTANKALLAVHGDSLARLSAANNAPLLFEAAVAGGIPAIKTVREGLVADRLLSIGGILNGTCNYILTAMRETGRDFSDVLAEAQALGYAEADPSTDVDGIDAAHKLTILASLAFGHPVEFDSVHVEGIRSIGALDLSFARTLGYRIKLLGLARQSDRGVEARVAPCLVPEGAPIAQVDGVFNAVIAEGTFVGRLMVEGRGAGAGPTASAVAADIIDIARGNTVPVWGMDVATLQATRSRPASEWHGAFYLRLSVADRAGVIADITAILRDCGVSLSSMIQHPSVKQAENVPLVLVTHPTAESAMQAARERIAALDVVSAEPVLIRIENF